MKSLKYEQPKNLLEALFVLVIKEHGSFFFFVKSRGTLHTANVVSCERNCKVPFTKQPLATIDYFAVAYIEIRSILTVATKHSVAELRW